MIADELWVLHQDMCVQLFLQMLGAVGIVLAGQKFLVVVWLTLLQDCFSVYCARCWVFELVHFIPTIIPNKNKNLIISYSSINSSQPSEYYSLFLIIHIIIKQNAMVESYNYLSTSHPNSCVFTFPLSIYEVPPSSHPQG